MALSHNNETDSQDNTIVVVKQGGDSDSARVQSTRATGSEVALVVRAIPFEPKTFVALAQGIVPGANKSMISLLNATGSSVKVKIHEVRIINVQTTAVTGAILNFEINRITAHSAGTDLTPRPYDTSRTLSVSVTAKTNATVTEDAGPVTLKRMVLSGDEWGVGTQDVESLQHSFQTYGEGIINRPSDVSPIVLNATQGLHVKQTVSSTAGSFDLVIIFTEEPV